MDNAKRRLNQILSTVEPRSEPLTDWQKCLILPDGATASYRETFPPTLCVDIAINDRGVLRYKFEDKEYGLVLSSLGTEYQEDNPVPKYKMIRFLPFKGTSSISIPDFWASIYVLWTRHHIQEYIPVEISSHMFNASDLEKYLISSGLGRRALDRSVSTIFLDRFTFWQGAGTGTVWNNERGWLREPYGSMASSFPLSLSFTRSKLVIAQHPLRPPKPHPGTCVYKRFSLAVGKTFSLVTFDINSSEHMEAFHRWHNDELVNKGWGERGTMERHKAYISQINAELSILPLMMCWDDQLMGYTELCWLQENHIAPYVPDGIRSYDRGLHILVGEPKYRGKVYSQPWFRSVEHYMFLSDPRTNRILGEPKANNIAVANISRGGGMHIDTQFYFPYKKSSLTVHTRERFFKLDLLAHEEEIPNTFRS